jgi:hypothetical protein
MSSKAGNAKGDQRMDMAGRCRGMMRGCMGEEGESKMPFFPIFPIIFP